MNAGFREMNCHSLTTTHFQKKCSGMEVLGMRVPSSTSLKFFFFRVQITQILLFLRVPVWKRSKVTVWERHIFKNVSTMEVLGMRLSHVKRYFQMHQWLFFGLKLKSLRLCCFRKCWFGRDKRSHFENDTFSKMFCAMEVLSMCLLYLKGIFPH